MKTVFAVDLDGTVLDNRDRLTKAGPEPDRNDLPALFKWLDVLMDRETMPHDKQVPGMRALAWALYVSLYNTFGEKVIYLTARNENLRDLTEQWLKNNGFPNFELHMRGKDDVQADFSLKRDLIRSFNAQNVVVIDDDPSGNLERVCREEGWTMLKAVSCLPR